MLFSLIVFAQIVTLILKLSGEVEISWLLTLTPVLAGATLFLILVLVAVAVAYTELDDADNCSFKK
jgi:hypothetical protein